MLINYNAFDNSGLRSINLPDSIRHIGSRAFRSTKILNIRIPASIISLGEQSFADNRCMFSVEMPDNCCISCNNSLFLGSFSLRNIAFRTVRTLYPVLDYNDNLPMVIISPGYDLSKLFGSNKEALVALTQRFEGLPIHRHIYYQTYGKEPLTKESLFDASHIKRSGSRENLRRKLDTSGNKQDCLGMTPLHILACSSKQDLGPYQTLVDVYPTNLVIKDRWGALAFLYLLWGDAPDDIVTYLSRKYNSLHPNFDFDWGAMIIVLTNSNVPPDIIGRLLRVKCEFFMEQTLCWEMIVVQLIEGQWRNTPAKRELFLTTVKLYLDERVSALGIKGWKDVIEKSCIPSCHRVQQRGLKLRILSIV